MLCYLFTPQSHTLVWLDLPPHVRAVIGGGARVKSREINNNNMPASNGKYLCTVS